MSKIALSVLTIIVLAVGVTLIDPPSRPNSRPKQATEHRPVALGKFYRANIEYWERHLARDPYSASAVRSIAAYKIVLARATGDESLYREAGELLDRSAAFIPKGDPEAALLRARTRMARHRFSDALAIVDSALALNPGHRGLRETRADALQGRGEYERALAEIEALLNEKKEFSYDVRRALLLDIVGRDAEGYEVLRTLEQRYKVRDPEPLAWLRLMRGVYHLKRNELDQALTEFELSLKVAPDYYLAQEHIAEVYELKKDSGRAKPYLEAAISTRRDPHLLLRLAEIEATQGNSDRSSELRAEAMAKLAADAAADPVAHGRDFAELLLDENRDLDEALRLSTVELEARPGDIRSNLVHARALRLLGRTAEARSFLAKAGRYPHTDSEVSEEAAQLPG